MKRLLSAAAGVCIGGLAYAQPPPADKPQWSFGIGVISSPQPYVGAKNRTFPVPLVGLNYKRFFVQGIRLGYQVVRRQKVDLNASLSARFMGYEASDSPFLEGMEERRGSADAELEGSLQIGDFRLKLALRTDVLNRSGGQEAALDIIRPFSLVEGRWRLEPSLGVRWQSADLVDYYYGVRPEEIRPDRPAFEGRSAANVAGGVLSLYRLRKRLLLSTLASLERLDNDIADSPIVRSGFAWFGLVGVSYRF